MPPPSENSLPPQTKEVLLAENLPEGTNPDPLLNQLGISPEEKEDLLTFLGSASPAQLAQVQDEVSKRMGSLDSDQEIQATAASYVKGAATLAAANLDDSTMQVMRRVMRQSGNDLTVLGSVLIAGAAGQEVARQRLWRLLHGTVVKAGREHGLALGGIEAEDKASAWAAQRYPLLAELEGGERIPLLKLLAMEARVALEKGESQVAETGLFLEPAQAFGQAKDEVIAVVKPWEEKLSAPKVEIPFGEPTPLKNLTYGFEFEQEDLITAAIQQFHPEKGEYWGLDAEEATKRLDFFAGKIIGIDELPPEILRMLTLAALAPDRGLALARNLNKEISDRQGLLALVARCPEELRSLKESVIVNQFQGEIARDFAAEVREGKSRNLSFDKDEVQLKYQSRGMITDLLVAGLMPNCSAAYLSWLINDVRAALSPANENAVLGGFELMDLLVKGDAIWEESRRWSLGSQPVPGSLRAGWVDDRHEFLLLVDPNGTDFIGYDEAKTDLFFKAAIARIKSEKNLDEREHLLASLTWKNRNLAVSDARRLEILEVLADFPNEYPCGSVMLLDHWFRGTTLEPKNWFGSTYTSQRVKLPKIKADLERLRSTMAERQKISDKLLTGTDMSVVVAVKMEKLRGDESYREWDGRVKAEFAEWRERLTKPVKADMKKGWKLDTLYWEQYLRWLEPGKILFENEGIDVTSGLVRAAVDSKGDKFSPADLEAAFEAAADVDLDLLRRSYIPSKGYGIKDYYLPFCADKERAFLTSFEEQKMDAITFCSQAQAEELAEAYEEWGKATDELEKNQFFRETIDFRKLRAELQELTAIFQKAGPDGPGPSQLTHFEGEQTRNLINLVLELRAIEAKRKEMGVVIEEGNGAAEVVEGINLRLAAETHQFENGKTIFDGIKRVSMRVGPGTCLALTGPAGGGKSVALETFGQTLVEATGYVPLAGRVELPYAGRFASAQVGIVGLEKEPWSGKSLFQTEAGAMAVAQRYTTTTAMDEPGMGSPADLRIPIVLADITERMARGERVVIATHQGVALAEMFDILGWGDRFSPVFITPDTHELHSGIGGSFGLEMLKMQEATIQFVSLCREFLDASSVGLSPESLSLAEIDLPPESAEVGDFADELTLESANLGKMVQFFCGRARIYSGNLANRVTSQFKTSLNGEAEAGIGIIGELEKSSLETHKETLSLVDNLDRLTDAASSLASLGEVAEMAVSSDLGYQDQFLRALAVDEIGRLKDEAYLDQVSEVLDYLPLTISGPLKARSQGARKALAEISFEPDLEAFSKVMTGEADWQRRETVNAIEREIRERNLGEDEAWQKKIEAAKAGLASDNYQAVMVLYESYFKNFSGSFYRVPSDTRKIIMKSMVAAKKNCWLQCAKADLSQVMELAEALEQPLNLLAFASITSYSTRIDNQQTPFCIPEEASEGNQLPFEQEIYKGYNLSLVYDHGRNTVKPQTIFYNIDGSPMDVPNLPVYEGMTVGCPQKVIAYTGVQGGGKSESLRMQLQFELLRKAIGRVPAEKARMGKPPKKVIGVIKAAQTRGVESSFMGEAARMAQTAAMVGADCMVFYDEPANGIGDQEKAAIVNALGYLVVKRGGSLVFTNHEREVYDGWQRLKSDSRIPWYPMGYEYTNDRSRRYQLQHGEVMGSETFKIAREEGMQDLTIDFAEWLYKVRSEFEAHKQRVL
ncbi:hypothetical protein A2160_05650 [Candidatus Beckwithbacteria bacterium RBG_13_42_9]|uniref:Uncharacterized protein n=1 Tax=Candidatus Beckwithbacteria bacterium RBG_13_42_9 TaxID=1797457 RepID=A0A1F5E624_9BACT|nr:MAG: hypothetical protein A2160_05650 [Candidatus Beckwithbacteria bacterium RBG_13_42_9]